LSGLDLVAEECVVDRPPRRAARPVGLLWVEHSASDAPGTLSQAIAEERPLARALDYGLIAPRLPALYDFAAESLGEPWLPELLNDGYDRQFG
jgi:hypothetical protein